MRKTIISTVCMLAAIVLAASCNKIDENALQVENNGRTVITVVAESICGGSKAHNQYSYDVLWDENDRIYVTNGNDANTFTVSDESVGTNKGKFTEDTPSYGITGNIEAFYPDLLKTDDGYVWPAVQADNQTAPMYAKQYISGTGNDIVNFSSLGAMLQIVFNTTVPNIVLKSIEIKDGTKPLSGGFAVDSEGKAVITAGGAAAITLDLGEDGKILGKSANYFYIAVPAGKYEDLTLTFTGADGGYFLMTGGNIDIQRNTVGRLTLTGSKYHPAILSGEFSIGDGKKVRFSPGNLRYDVSSGIWSFFRNQYDCGPATYAEGHDKEISLFTWGYGSWSTDPETEEYLPGVVGGADFSPAQDWGSRLGDGTFWRTLTRGEVKYLFDHSRRGRAVVCGINGQIIVPDTFVDPQTNRGSSAFVTVSQSEVDDTWEDNIYSSENDWNAMESAGAVFIPSAGCREKSNIKYYGNMCNFWTTTSNDMSNEGFAYRMHMNIAKGAEPVTIEKKYGLPVRLVTDVR